MRIDSFFVSFIFLVLSLLMLLFFENPLLSDIAYISTLLFIALFTVDDWIDVAFIKLARMIFTLSSVLFTANNQLERTKDVRHLFTMRQSRSLKARQRWSPEQHNNHMRRVLHNRRAF